MKTKSKIDVMWINIKIALKLPLPIKNHFYKWHRIKIFENAYCIDCRKYFDIKKSSNKDTLLSDIYCPHCKSKHFTFGNRIFKAKIDKKTHEEILEVEKELEQIYDGKKLDRD